MLESISLCSQNFLFPFPFKFINICVYVCMCMCINIYFYLTKDSRPKAISYNPFYHFEKIFAQFIYFYKFCLIKSFEFACLMAPAVVVVFVVFRHLVRYSYWTVAYFHSHSHWIYKHEICLYLIFELYILSLTDYKSTDIHFMHTYILHTVWSGHWQLFIEMQL